jgi:hypothetical protein
MRRAVSSTTAAKTEPGVVIFRRVWPVTLLVVGLIATMAWIGFLGYELFKFGALAF